MPAGDRHHEPRPEDFGITEADLERAPSLWTARCRPLLVAVLWAATVVVVFAVIYRATASPPAAVLFSLVLVAAGSIFLVPLLVCVACASERAEARWLCRRFPLLDACLAYRAALDAYRRRGTGSSFEARDPVWWMGLAPDVFRLQVERSLERCGEAPFGVADRETAGYDLAFNDGRGRVLVRCEAGNEPARVGSGRELLACLEETGAHRGLLVAAAGPSAELAAYLADRPLTVVRPWQLEELGRGGS